eukprot:CAMPEP_0198562316 /NCGR_PEP_ID=MMETSP1462-20131121/96948_1 /TAXON_ID=1333877 /ORGANISM="Brandtodinium nutriculum, Strain RCC3387" /LENGTH=116 /DNA_ID=CAMNT_0044293243 /DNA_START=34 /DNA_END=381 /DNA_ORIENTATION=-
MPAPSRPPPPLADLCSCSDFERAARECLPDVVWDYIAGGEADTMEENRSAFGAFKLRPRVLRDISAVDITSTLFGAATATPFYLSSVAKGGIVSGEAGEAAFVRAVATAGSTYIVP